MKHSVDVKTDIAEEIRQTKERLGETSKAFEDFAEIAFFGTAAIVLGYVAADTARQVIVHIVKVKVK